MSEWTLPEDAYHADGAWWYRDENDELQGPFKMLGEWRPIETAPKNGQPVLLFLNPPLNTNDTVGHATVGKLPIVVGWASDTWHGGVEWCCGFCEEGSADTDGYTMAYMLPVKPTYWQPLPEPPSGEHVEEK